VVEEGFLREGVEAAADVFAGDRGDVDPVDFDRALAEFEEAEEGAYEGALATG
jgi:hypothetical protein